MGKAGGRGRGGRGKMGGGGGGRGGEAAGGREEEEEEEEEEKEEEEEEPGISFSGVRTTGRLIPTDDRLTN